MLKAKGVHHLLELASPTAAHLRDASGETGLWQIFLQVVPFRKVAVLPFSSIHK